MSHTSAAPLRTTYCVFQIGSKLARSACGTKRSVRAARRWDMAGAASPAVAAKAPAPVADFRNSLRSMLRTPPTERASPERSIEAIAPSGSLADVPEKGQRSPRYPRDVPPPRLVRQIRSERRVDDVIESSPVQPACRRLLLSKRLRVVPGGDLGFDLWNARPTEHRLLAIGTQEFVGGVGRIHPIHPGVVEVPAAL